MDPSTDHPSPADAEVIRQVVEERACPFCGYDLRGQDVFADPHYQWPIVRCPECGRVHPLGVRAPKPWAAHMAMSVLGAAWVATALGVFVGFATAVFAVAHSAAYVSVHGVWRRGRMEPLGALGFVELLWAAPVALGFGLVLAMLMPTARRRTLVQVALAAAALGAAFWMLESRTYGSVLRSAPVRAVLAHGLTAILVAVATPLSRPVIRFLLAHVFPLWIAAGLPELWTRDGLRPPRTRSAKTSTPTPR